MGTSFTLGSRAVLGLLSKANELFAEDDVTLSFPLGAPVSFDGADLVMAMGPAPDAPAHALLAEFSTMMNWIPDGPVWPPSEPRRLDDIVRYVVQEGDWAVGSSTPEEEARRAAARALVDMANPVMSAYLTLRDTWIRALQELRNQPDDIVLVEAEARAKIAMLSYPQRDAIEQAQQELISLDERAPFRARERMQRQLDVGVGTFDDPSGGVFSPTRPLPRGVVDADGWSAVTLDREALAQLADTAPAELRDRLVPDGTDDDILSVSFEYASAQLNRQWLDAALFDLRCWRFPDRDRVLSDGGSPAAGDCPSYVRAVVFARNVRVARPAPPDGAPSTAGRGASDFLIPGVSIEADDVLRRAREWTDPRYTVQPDPAPPVPTEPVAEPDPVVVEPDPVVVEPDPVVVEPDPVVVEPDPVVRPDRPELVTLAPYEDGQILFRRRGRGLPTLGAGVRENTPTVAPFARRDVRTARRSDLLTAAQNTPVLDALAVEAASAPDFRMAFDPSLLTPILPAPIGPDDLVETSPDGRIIVLALICKRLHRSPDPDPGYGWP